MSQTPDQLHRRLQFYATAPYPCSYLPLRRARSQVLATAQPVDSATYTVLVHQGFRRSGIHIYRPRCDACQACLPIRVRVEDFRPDRTQRRLMRRHASMQITVRSPYFSHEHFALYQRYQRFRHGGGAMDSNDPQQYAQFMLQSTAQTLLVEFREKVAGAPSPLLRMVSIIDVLDDGLSAVYTFYESEAGPAHSWGTYNILWQISAAKQLALPYVYLGYWIGSCRKMNYKSRFQPCEVLRSGAGWQEFEVSEF